MQPKGAYYCIIDRKQKQNRQINIQMPIAADLKGAKKR